MGGTIVGLVGVFIVHDDAGFLPGQIGRRFHHRAAPAAFNSSKKNLYYFQTVSESMIKKSF